MSDFRIRHATAEGIEFLRVLAADFGQAHLESPALRSWMDPEWDFGVVAVDDQGRELGAAWCRAFRAVVIDGELNPELREPFLGVVPEHRGFGVGGRLLDALIDQAARKDKVVALVGRVVHGERTEQVERMLARREFTRNDVYRSRGLGTFWRLALLDEDPNQSI